MMPVMTFGDKLKSLRAEIGLSQEAIGAQGFVSTPGWIKIENGQRQASENLIERLTAWLVGDKHIRQGAAKELKEELLTLKYLGSRSFFVRELATKHAKTLANATTLLAAEDPATYNAKRRRGRPAKKKS